MSSLVEKVKEKVRRNSTHRRSGSLPRESLDSSARPYTTESNAPAVPQVPAGYSSPARTSVDNRRSGHFGDAGTGSNVARVDTQNSASRHNRNVSNLNNDYGTPGSSPIAATRGRDTTGATAPNRATSGFHDDGYLPTSTGLSNTTYAGTPVNEETRRLGLEADMARMSLEKSASKPTAYPAENAQRFSPTTRNGTADHLHEHLRLPPGFHITNEVRTYVDEHQRPAVTEQKIINQRTEIIQEAISRDIHVHHYYTYVQPIRVVEILPARHWHHDHQTGVRTEIAAPAGWAMPANLTPGVPDMSSYDLRGYERHYLVNDTHPRGVLEDFIHPGREGKQEHHLSDNRHVSPATLPPLERAFPSKQNSTSTERSFNTAASTNSNYGYGNASLTSPPAPTTNNTGSSSAAVSAARSATIGNSRTANNSNTSTTGPHTSSLLNKLDPRVDSNYNNDRAIGSNTVGGRTPSNTISSGYGTQPITGSTLDQTPVYGSGSGNGTRNSTIAHGNGSSTTAVQSGSTSVLGNSSTVTSPSTTTTTRVGNRI